jgi:hypothetical protein
MAFATSPPRYAAEASAHARFTDSSSAGEAAKPASSSPRAASLGEPRDARRDRVLETVASPRALPRRDLLLLCPAATASAARTLAGISCAA